MINSLRDLFSSGILNSFQSFQKELLDTKDRVKQTKIGMKCNISVKQYRFEDEDKSIFMKLQSLPYRS